MKALERAADVRTSLINTQPIETVVVKDVSVDNLFRSEFYNVTDVPLNYNLSTPPKLGDRVINLTSTGVPFGLKGTVIVSHRATGYVEVSNVLSYMNLAYLFFIGYFR